jgi:hypothetical protein
VALTATLDAASIREVPSGEFDRMLIAKQLADLVGRA